MVAASRDPVGRGIADLPHQREIVDVFLAASRIGDFEALVAILDSDVVFRVDVDPNKLSGLVFVG